MVCSLFVVPASLLVEPPFDFNLELRMYAMSSLYYMFMNILDIDCDIAWVDVQPHSCTLASGRQLFHLI